MALGAQPGSYNLALSEPDAGGANPTPEVELVFDTGAAAAGVTWTLPSPQNWASDGAFGLTFQNLGSNGIEFAVELRNGTGTSAVYQRGWGVAIEGTTQTFVFSFTDAARQGMLALPTYAGCIPTLYAPTLTSGFGADVTAVNLHFDAPPTPAWTLIVSDPEVWSAQPSFVGLVDGFGQYTGRTWPEKASSQQDLLDQAAAEAPALFLDAGTPDPELDDFGGTTRVATRAATGYFRIEADSDGGYWLVDPLGNLFFSIGMDGIGPRPGTLVTGRETMFEDLPDGGPFFHLETGTYGPVSSGETFDFVWSNAGAKYEVADPTQTLYDVALRRLRAWGFNTVGAFSTDDYAQGSGYSYSTRVPYTVYVFRTGVSATLLVAGRAMPDPYDPAFAANLAGTLQHSGLSSAITDPYLMGYFVDNELPWAPYSGPNPRLALGTAVLESDGTQDGGYAKRKFVEILSSEYDGGVANLNMAWGTSYGNFNAMLPSISMSDAGLTAAAQTDLEALSGAFAQQYFSTVQTQLRAFDSNHLYLGAKFSAYTPEALAACALYADVISFDIYQPALPDTGSLAKPALIAEYSFGAADRGMFWGGIAPVGTQADRAASYSAYLNSVLANHQFVGAHWYQYWDEPVLGRYFDGENGNYGFVSVTDDPYPEMVTAAQATNAAVYPTLVQ